VVKRLVTYIAWLWHNIAPYQGNFLPLPGKKRHVGRKKEKHQGRRREKKREKDYSRFYSSLFTKPPETPINTGVPRGEEWRCTLHHSSPLFTRFTNPVTIEDRSQPLLKAEAGHH